MPLCTKQCYVHLITNVAKLSEKKNGEGKKSNFIMASSFPLYLGNFSLKIRKLFLALTASYFPTILLLFLHQLEQFFKNQAISNSIYTNH